MHNISQTVGRSSGAGRRFAIVASRFNERIVELLVRGAVDTLLRQGVSESDLEVHWVPGAWELPLAASTIAKTAKVDGIVALGAVIRGETSHYDYVCAACCQGLAAVSQESGIPLGLGVLTCETSAQAEERAGGKAGNKGREAAQAALEMADFLATLRDS